MENYCLVWYCEIICLQHVVQDNTKLKSSVSKYTVILRNWATFTLLLQVVFWVLGFEWQLDWFLLPQTWQSCLNHFFVIKFAQINCFRAVLNLCPEGVKTEVLSASTRCHSFSDECA